MLADFLRLHLSQSIRIFRAVLLPPFESGIKWSYSSRSWLSHSLQRALSRLHTSHLTFCGIYLARLGRSSSRSGLVMYSRSSADFFLPVTAPTTTITMMLTIASSVGWKRKYGEKLGRSWYVRNAATAPRMMERSKSNIEGLKLFYTTSIKSIELRSWVARWVNLLQFFWTHS